MKWLKDVSGGSGFETEKVKWFEFEKARKKLFYSAEKKILGDAKAILNQEIQKI